MFSDILLLTRSRCETLHASATFADQDGNPGTMEVDMNVDCTGGRGTSVMTMPPGSVTWTSPTAAVPDATGPGALPTGIPNQGAFEEQARIHRVDVGMQGQFLFDPIQVAAIPGDVVLFTFHPLNHTLTEGSFEAPCLPLDGGFDTGFTNFNLADVNQREVAITVNDEDPRWFFCKQQSPRISL